MGKYKLLIAVTLAFFVIPVFSTETTSVYCAKPDASCWVWLLNSSNNYIQVEGAWGEYFLSNNIYFSYFTISEENYKIVSAKCPVGFVVQPGNPNSSYWDVFKIMQENGVAVIADGTQTIHNITDLKTRKF